MEAEQGKTGAAVDVKGEPTVKERAYRLAAGAIDDYLTNRLDDTDYSNGVFEAVVEIRNALEDAADAMKETREGK